MTAADQMAKRVITTWEARFSSQSFKGLFMMNPIQLGQRIDELVSAINAVLSVFPKGQVSKEAMSSIKKWLKYFFDNLNSRQIPQLLNELRTIKNPEIQKMVDKLNHSSS